MRDIDDILSDIDGEDNIDKFLEETKLGVDDESDEENIDGEDVNLSETVTSGQVDDDVPLPVNDKEFSYNDEGTSDENSASSQLSTSANEGQLPSEINFTVKGSKSWNTREPYIIDIDGDELSKEMKYLAKAFYFISAPSEENFVKNEVLRTLVNAIRGQGQSIMERYVALLKKVIEEEVALAVESFGFGDSLKDLFIYHMGPQTVERMIVSRFQRTNFGFCYIPIDSSRAKRFLPQEFIKKCVLEWYEENVHSQNLDFDSVQYFEKIKTPIQKKYQQLEKKFNITLYELNAKVGPRKHISKERLLSVKGDQWFGFSNMIVYKRFVLKTIFP